jgi:hypothetical protein
MEQNEIYTICLFPMELALSRETKQLYIKIEAGL